MIARSLVFVFLMLFPLSLKAQDFSLLDSALTQVGLTPSDVGFDQDEMATYGGDRWRSSYFTLFHKNPLSLPRHASMTMAELSDAAMNPTALVAFAGRRIDCPIRRTLIGDPIEKYVTQPDQYPLFSVTEKRNVLIGKQFKMIRDRADILFRLVDDKESLFRRAIDPVDKGKYRDRLRQYFIDDSLSQADFVEELQAQLDLNRLVAGAQDIAEVILRIVDSLEFCTFPEYIVEVKTGKGNIVIGTAGPDKYEYVDAPLLIIDGGGDDLYSFPNDNHNAPLTVIVDLAGNDRYLHIDTAGPGFGGAMCGVSMLVDLAGDDFYEGRAVCQGAGIFGVGVLIDESGADTYTALEYSQGAGAFGLGILADATGNDSFTCQQTSQGFGYTKGCGILVNVEGDDRYIARDDSLFDPSSQTPDHNNSMAQGVGFGRRADFLDGHSWAGGVGILCDSHGNDSYSAGLFAQGCAYWFSVGMLLDGDGNDLYNGVWYVQGAGAHYAVAYLDDMAGDDAYTATHNMADGAGHDFTIGYLNERAGNDRYTVPNLSLGGGNANGIGIFNDHGGDDIYTTKPNSTTLGRANPSDQGPRAFLTCLGIFIDAGGQDTYSEIWAGNGRRWIGPPAEPDKPMTNAVGVGIDR
jgi:hypothetical protein